MAFDPDKHHRRTIRLQTYDYRWAGAYFVTICTYQRECTLGEIVDGVMRLSAIGRIVQEEWLQTAVIRPYVVLDEFVIMPNHLHGIVIINAGRRAGTTESGDSGHGAAVSLREGFARPVKGSLSSIIRSYKAAVTRRVNDMEPSLGRTPWQGRFYEHVIRDDADLQRVREYILTNPARWAEDADNLQR